MTLITIKEAIINHQLSRSTLYYWIKKGFVYKDKKCFRSRVSDDDVRRMVRENR